jgi:hypothetical protein
MSKGERLRAEGRSAKTNNANQKESKKKIPHDATAISLIYQNQNKMYFYKALFFNDI